MSSMMDSIWRGMMDRCFNPKNKNFKNYGGRGITVCDRWKDKEKFIEDMGDRPGMDILFDHDMNPKRPKYSIDRIDVNGNYEPGNCRWADAVTQAQNKRVPGRGFTVIERNGRFTVRVRLCGVNKAATFATREEAEQWGKETSQAAIDKAPAATPTTPSAKGSVMRRRNRFTARYVVHRTFSSDDEARDWLNQIETAIRNGNIHKAG